MPRCPIDCFSLFSILGPNFVLPPYSFTLSCNFVNVYTIRFTRVHARIPTWFIVSWPWWVRTQAPRGTARHSDATQRNATQRAASGVKEPLELLYIAYPYLRAYAHRKRYHMFLIFFLRTVVGAEVWWCACKNEDRRSRRPRCHESRTDSV